VLRTGYTYGGHATSTAAGLACLDVMEKEGLLDASTELGRRLSTGLRSLVDDGLYAGVRGEGFVWALETLDHQDPPAVRNRVLEAGVIVRPLVGALAMCPPLVTTPEQVDRVVDALATAAAG
jgi:adenosylmethionine-8-amino-7-oxononanoate aminotransferase